LARIGVDWPKIYLEWRTSKSEAADVWNMDTWHCTLQQVGQIRINELNLSRLYVYDVINHGYEASILILYNIILCSKFNDSVFCTSSNVKKQTKPKKAYNKQQSINFSTFWSDANDNGYAAFKLNQYE
jgi:hypothetical protein